MEVKFKCDINPNRIAAKIAESKEFWTIAHLEWWRLITPYTPFQTGNLAEDVTITAEAIKYNSPYANRMYKGDNFNFRKDKHPLASARWDRAAKPSQLPCLARTLNNYIKSGRFKF